VDKSDFLHKLKGLPAFEAAEQGLFLTGMETGQKNGCGQVAWFRTFDPVDIHGLVHRRAIAGQVGVVIWLGPAAFPESEIFFEQATFGRKVSIRRSLLSKPPAWLGVSPTGVEKIFQAIPRFETRSSGLPSKSIYTE
jgi:hypothetical protein